MARSLRGAILAGLVFGPLAMIGACVLADPPADLPVLPLEPPVIERASVAPPVSDLLQVWPDFVSIPVIADPSATVLDYEILIDPGLQGPLEGNEGVVGGGSVPVPEDSGVFLSSIPVPRPDYLSECHTLEIFVYYENATSLEDSVSWFFSPTGSFQGCPILFDAGADASDDAPEAGE